jgi:hypothetical protein
MFISSELLWHGDKSLSNDRMAKSIWLANQCSGREYAPLILALCEKKHIDKLNKIEYN